MKWEFEERAGSRACTATSHPYGTYLFYVSLFFMIGGGILALVGSGSKPAMAFGVCFFLCAVPLMLLSFFTNNPSTALERKDDTIILNCLYRFSTHSETVPLAMGPRVEVKWNANPLFFTPGKDGGAGIWHLVLTMPTKQPIFLGESQSKDELSKAAEKMNSWLLGSQPAGGKAPDGPDVKPPTVDDIPQPANVNIAGLAILFVLIGVFCIFWGGLQYAASKDCSPFPVKGNLTDLENGKSPPDFHLKLGEHVAVYSHSIVRCRGTSEPTARTRVSWVKYPILSRKNPFFRKLNKLAKKYGSVKNIPTREYPEIETFAVLVLTRKWKRYGEIPDKMEKLNSVEGLVTNRIAPLTSEQKRLINKVFPKILTSELWILEKGRHPYSKSTCYALVGGGFLSLLLAAMIAVMFSVKGKDK